MNVIRESGRHDIKNPHEDLIGNSGFTFHQKRADNPEESKEVVEGAIKADEEMKDESEDIQIDTSSKPNSGGS